MEEMLKEILITVKNIEKRVTRLEEKVDRLEERMDRLEERQKEFDKKLENMSKEFDQKLDQKISKSTSETAIEIGNLAETISKIMNKKHDELLTKIDELTKKNQVEHNIFEAKQKWIESEIEKINMQKVG